MADEHMDESQEEVTRPPEETDLVSLCKELNQRGAKYIVIGGFAIIAAGYPRFTEDVDLLVDVSLENEQKVIDALMTLPDQAVKELTAGEIDEFVVVRVGDEFTIDLMKSACGVSYQDASHEIILREIQGVQIPFATPRLLWRMKATTHREKDALDLVFLRNYFIQRGEPIPENR